MNRNRVGTSIAVDNPLLRLQLSHARLRIVIALIAIAFAVLAVRAFYLQVIDNESLQRFGERSYTQTIELAASRGKILDRNGVVLASSLPAQAITVNPAVFEANAKPEHKRALAEALGIDQAALERRIERGGRHFAYLRRQMEPAQARAILALGIPGISTENEFKRYYPEGKITAHVVGITGVDDIGREGIELASEDSLRGTLGQRRVMRDRFGRVIGDMDLVQRPSDGADEVLSLDSRIQFMTFTALREAVEAHAAKSGSAVVLDVRTGEILALANWPTYDPNDRSKITWDAMRNRVLVDSFEPGSTMKPFTTALALEMGKVRPETVVDIGNGRLKIGPDTIGDSHFLGSALTVEQIVQKSSNVGTAKIALEMSAQDMWGFFQSLGFGVQPDIEFPGAVTGRLRPWRAWRPVEQATISYGHGLSVSLLQLARAYMLFARDGEIAPITIHRSDAAAPGERLISARTAKSIRHMLELATGPDGTAPHARVVGYRVAGKTGTSLKNVNGRYIKRYISTFAGFAPVSDPRIIVAVSLDDPTSGKIYAGDVVAPLFSRVTSDALRQLRVAPDAPMAEVSLPGDEPPPAAGRKR